MKPNIGIVGIGKSSRQKCIKDLILQVAHLDLTIDIVVQLSEVYTPRITSAILKQDTDKSEELSTILLDYIQLVNKDLAEYTIDQLKVNNDTREVFAKYFFKITLQIPRPIEVHMESFLEEVNQISQKVRVENCTSLEQVNTSPFQSLLDNIETLSKAYDYKKIEAYFDYSTRQETIYQSPSKKNMKRGCYTSTKPVYKKRIYQTIRSRL